jgi:CheY-like chemotaxis protein
MTAKRPTILVVDDSLDVLQLYERLLSPHYTIKIATNADDAFALVRDWHPDVLLTDISMPGRSGLDLITQIRSDLAPPLPRIGVISGFPDLEAEARSRGAALFLLKPFDLASLEDAIRELLRGPTVGSSVERKEAVHGRRAAALSDAEQFVARFIAENPGAADTATRATENVARYLGVSIVILLLARAGELEVFASSDPDRFPQGADVGGSLGYATSVIASGATLYVPTHGLLADLGELPDTDRRLVACAAVRSPNGQPIAGLALLSDRDRPFDPRDLAIVEDVAHATEEVLLGRRGLRQVTSACRFHSDLWWRRLLDRELERVGDGFAVSVTLANVVSSPTERDEPGEAIFAQVSDHMMVAVRHDRQLAVFKRAADATAARDAVRRCLVTIDETVRVSAAATLTLIDIQPPRRSEVVVEILEGLMAADGAREAGTVVNATLSATVERVS